MITEPTSPGPDPRTINEFEPPIPPGEVLGHEFMVRVNIGPTALARAMHVPVNRITDILAGKRRITARTALLLATHFETSPEFWMRLQMDYDLRLARRDRFRRSQLQTMRNTTRPP